MAYLELSFDLEGETPDTAESICFQAGALAVTLCDARDEAVLEPAPGEVRLWRRTRVQALFDVAEAGVTLIQTLAQALDLPAGRLQARAVQDRVWEREWLRDFHPMRFGQRLWVAPRHETVTAPDAIVVQLDPGLAFGTGTHPTTAMCLAWLDAQPLQGLEVVDFGCGSGILAIAALKLGARHAHAYDIDPQALLATRDNAIQNQVHERLTVCASERELPPGRDLLLANILADILIAQRSRLAQLLRPGGQGLLSGILHSQQGDVVSAFEPWFGLQRFARREDWVSLDGRRRS